MIKRSAIILVYILIFFLLKSATQVPDKIFSESTIITGLILVSAFLFATLIKEIKLPRLTGFMIMGLILGPVGVNFITERVLDELHFLENMALAFIALTAGGELKFSRVGQQLISVTFILIAQVLVVFVGLFLLLILISNYLPFLADLNRSYLIGFAILFSATAISKSPATTIGIITELKAKGNITNLVLSITVFKSILLVLVFPIIIAWSKLFLIEGTSLNFQLVSSLLMQVSGSILTGVIVGLMVIGFLKYIKIEKSIFLLGTTIIITEISTLYGFDILLAAIVAGIVVENFSKQGEDLIKGVEQSSLPLYIIFFCFAGAALHIDTLKDAFFLTIFLVFARMGLIYIANYFGAAAAKESMPVKHLSWLGFIGQAGIAVGLATIIEKSFPGSVGIQFKTILISSVVINELLGPVLFKYLLVKVKETGTE